MEEGQGLREDIHVVGDPKCQKRARQGVVIPETEFQAFGKYEGGLTLLDLSTPA